MFDLIQEIAQTIRNNKLRTALTGIAVAWGVFMLIVLLGVARGVTNNFEEQSASSSMNTIRMWGGSTSIPYKGYKDGRWIRLRDGDMEEAVEKVGGIEDGSKVASPSGFNVVGPKDYSASGVSAVYPDARRTQRIKKIRGRFINQADIDLLRRSIVISSKTADIIFGDTVDPLGKSVKGIGLSWTVVGVYESDWNNTGYIPYTTYKAVSGADPYVEEIDFRLADIKNDVQAEEIEEGVRAVMARRHEFDTDDSNAVHVWNQLANFLKNSQANIYLNVAVWVIGILTLLTGIVGVSNIMFVSVRERVHEIGIRRAIGAKPRSVIVQILAESVAITAISGYAGIVAGMALLEALKPLLEDKAGFSNPTVDVSIALQVTGALILTGALAGLFPAIKATKVKPVEALRDE